MYVTAHSRNRDADSTIARCKAVGADHVCLSVAGVSGAGEAGVANGREVRDFVGRLRDAGIATPVAILWFGNDPAIVLDPSGDRRYIDDRRRTLDAFGQAGVGAVLHYIDLAQSENPDDDERYWDGLLRLFRPLVAAAESADVRLANHAIWRCIPDPLRSDALAKGVTMADYRHYAPEGWRGPYLLTDHTHIQRLIDSVPSPHNGACFCTGMHIMGGDVPALVDVFKGRIHYSQMRDLRGRWPAAEEVFLGEGELDFADILRRLDAAGYRGGLGPEHLGQPSRSDQDLEAEAIAFVQTKLAEVGAARVRDR